MIRRFAAALLAAFLLNPAPLAGAEEAPVHAAAATPCTKGMAGNYPCNNIDLQSVLPLSDRSRGGR